MICEGCQYFRILDKLFLEGIQMCGIDCEVKAGRVAVGVQADSRVIQQVGRALRNPVGKIERNS